jgi:hypothetical protein
MFYISGNHASPRPPSVATTRSSASATVPRDEQRGPGRVWERVQRGAWQRCSSVPRARDSATDRPAEGPAPLRGQRWKPPGFAGGLLVFRVRVSFARCR